MLVICASIDQCLPLYFSDSRRNGLPQPDCSSKGVGSDFRGIPPPLWRCLRRKLCRALPGARDNLPVLLMILPAPEIIIADLPPGQPSLVRSFSVIHGVQYPNFGATRCLLSALFLLTLKPLLSPFVPPEFRN
jgi:hypothetical protein